MGGGDGHACAREDHDREHGAELNAEAARRRLQSELVAKRRHDVVTRQDKAHVEREPAVGKEPQRNLSFLGKISLGVDKPDSRDGRQRVGDVVGAVRDREEEARRQLQHLEHLLRLRVRLERLGMHRRVLRLQLANVHVESGRHHLAHLGIPGVVLLQFDLGKPESLPNHRLDLRAGVPKPLSHHSVPRLPVHARLPVHTRLRHHTREPAHAVGHLRHLRRDRGRRGSDRGSRLRGSGGVVRVHRRCLRVEEVRGLLGVELELARLLVSRRLLTAQRRVLVVAHAALGDGEVVEHGVPREVLVVLDGALGPGDHEDETQERKADADTEGDGNRLRERKILGRRRALEKHEPAHDAERHKEVKGEQQDAALDSDLVGVRQHDELDREVDEGRDHSRHHRRDEPGRDNAKEPAVVLPLHTARAPSRHTDTEDGADDSVRGGDRHGEDSRDKHPQARAKVHARHAEREHVRVALEPGELDHLLADCVRHRLSEHHHAQELSDARNHASLPVGDRLGADSVGEGVGNVVGTNGVRIKERPAERPHDHALVEPRHATLWRVDQERR
mmetsp:Transcript_31746/g.22970  ORF Transcript_31746/g.22970 Transcript_31746/m.22970 type:complete len:561 (-) Transcript_31746:143-1825(-)